ncbi:MAG: Lin0512 family protein, partial [Phycisphaerales bacterium]
RAAHQTPVNTASATRLSASVPAAMPASAARIAAGLSRMASSDATKAAVRAVEDTIRRVLFPRMRDVLPDGDRANMRVEATIAVPGADRVDVDDVCGRFPYGKVTVRAVEGGHRQPNGLIGDDGTEGVILVAVAVIAVGW